MNGMVKTFSNGNDVMNKNRLMQLFVAGGLGCLLLVAANFCYALAGIYFNMELYGLDNPFLFVSIVVMSVWGFFSVWMLPIYMKWIK